MSRVNPFEDLADFETKSTPKRVDPAVIERVAHDNDFPSRQPVRSAATAPSPAESGRARRRYTTGRNKQINIKATDTTIERFYRLADQQHVPLGELLERALEVYERSVSKASR